MKTKRSRDPSQTYLLRRQFIVSMNKRFNIVKLALREFFTGDVQDFTLADSSVKIVIFRKWLRTQIDENILKTTGAVNVKSWMSVYVTNAYCKGLVRSYGDVNKVEKVLGGVNWFGGAQNQFLRDALRMTPIISQIELLEMRIVNLLQGVADDMLNKMSWVLANGISKGYDFDVIRKELESIVNKVSKRRSKLIVIAEIVHAQAEGQLDGLELLGIDTVDAVTELLTTKKSSVCSVCKKLEEGQYSVTEARGIIPFHPLCTCAWSIGESALNLKRKA